MTQARDLADGKFDTDTLVVDAAGNNVGIGTANPSHELHLHKGSSDSNYLLITNSTTGSNNNDGLVIGLAADETALVYHQENSAIRFGTNSTERMRVTNNGITFNGDTAAANALDDYEEGTYTPQISATDGIGTMTYSAQVGRYTKVGNRVSFNLYVSIASKGTLAGSLRFTLPFTVNNVTNYNSVFSWWINSAVSGQRFDGDTMQFCFASPNSSIALPYGSNGSGGLDHLNANHVQNGTDFMVGGTYEV